MFASSRVDLKTHPSRPQVRISRCIGGLDDELPQPADDT
jgi:hypothetical protein